MSALPMNSLAAAIATLASLVERFPDLPAVDATLSTIFPDRLSLSFHRDLGMFEAWRSALDISHALVSKEREIDGPLMWLTAETVLDGVTVQLTGYGLQKTDAADQATPWEVAT